MFNKCNVCGSEVKVDKWGNGKCKFCGWNQDSNSNKFPNSINSPNFVSLNKARELFKDDKPFKPSFDDFFDLIDRGFDISFMYKGKKYQIDKHEDFTLWEMGTKNYSSFKTLEEVKYNACIDGQNLKDIWNNIKKLNYEN